MTNKMATIKYRYQINGRYDEVILAKIPSEKVDSFINKLKEQISNLLLKKHHGKPIIFDHEDGGGFYCMDLGTLRVFSVYTVVNQEQTAEEKFDDFLTTFYMIKDA